MSKCDNLVSQGFKYGKTFAEVEKEVDRINNQISMFDLLREDK